MCVLKILLEAKASTWLAGRELSLALGKFCPLRTLSLQGAVNGIQGAWASWCGAFWLPAWSVLLAAFPR